MIQTIDAMLNKFESGKITRRQLVLFLAAVAAAAAQADPKEEGFPAISINHITVKVPDLHRTSSFYQEFFGMPLKQHSAKTHILGVGNSCFFGIEQGDAQARVDHFDFGITSFDADAIRAKLTKLNLKFDSNSKESFKFTDPDGFLVQVNAPDYVGHVS
jgi:catechol 2,3-dioxygenase-like lactoylglutathione lyase family enzyme